MQGGGLEETFLRSDLLQMKASSLSLMPEGLEQAINPQDLADLIGFVKGQVQAAFGSADRDKAAQARAVFFAAGPSSLGQVVSASERLDYPSWLGRWPLSVCRQTDGQSKLVWQTPPVPPPGEGKAPVRFRFPAALGLFSQPAGKFQLKVNGKLAVEFDVTLHDEFWQSGDGKVRMNYTMMESNAEDSNGLLVIEVACDLIESGKPVDFEAVGSAGNSSRWFGVYAVSETAQAARK